MFLKISCTTCLIFLLSSCGSVQQTSVRGLVETTQVLLYGEELVGMSIQVNGTDGYTIRKEDLKTYEFGILGSKNSAREDLQMVRLILSPGSQLVTLRDRGRTVFEKRTFLSKGQTKEFYVGEGGSNK